MSIYSNKYQLAAPIALTTRLKLKKLDGSAAGVALGDDLFGFDSKKGIFIEENDISK